MTNISMRIYGESKFCPIARDLGELVKSSKATSEDALLYIQFISDLGPSFYNPPHDILVKALSLAETRVNWEAEDDLKIRRYESLRDVAERYGLSTESDEYTRKISTINNPETTKRNFFETTGTYLRLSPD